MKKTALFIIAAVMSVMTFGQTFDGVTIGGNVNAFAEKFKQKGYKVEKVHEHGITMSGNFAGYSIEFYITKTPKTNLVAKVGIYFPKHVAWNSIYSEYMRMFEILNKKYGEPLMSKMRFTTPYELGDGYEMTAVAIEKCEYMSIWAGDNLGILLEISKHKQVYMSYENSANMELLSNERDVINSSRF
jgi:hypothetical protein